MTQTAIPSTQVSTLGSTASAVSAPESADAESESAPAKTGTCYGIGVGPGDPELITVKTLRILQSSPVVAYFSAVGKQSNARRIVDSYLSPEQAELHLVYPVTTEDLPAGVSYEELLINFYDAVAEQLRDVLDAGKDVAVLCEGDPFFHGSYMYVHNRLCGSHRTEVVPGISSILAASAVTGAPLVCRDEVLTVLSAALPTSDLSERLRSSDAAVVMKVGRRMPSVYRAVADAGLLDRAWYVERATMADQRVAALSEVDPTAPAPYFSMIVVPSPEAPGR